MQELPYRYRRIAHTADLGIFVRGESLDGMLANAGWAVTDVIVDAPAVEPATERTVRLESASAEQLLMSWVGELLYLWETKLFVGSRFTVRVSGETALEARIGGETYDAERHGFKTEVKAVTYHHLRVEQTPRGWRSLFILDL